MIGMPGCRFDWAILPPPPPWGDVGVQEATIEMHAYLHCDDCGSPLWHGETYDGATIFVCRFPRCSKILDKRRVP